MNARIASLSATLAVAISMGTAMAAPSPAMATVTSVNPARFSVIDTTTHVTSRGAIVVVGTAINPTESTYDRAAVRVDLYDADGTLLNPRVPGELPQTAGSTIRPGDIVPFRWSQALPAGFDHARVHVRGVERLAGTPYADVDATVTSRTADSTGAGTIVRGRVSSESPMAVGLELAVYDGRGRLLTLASATFGGDFELVTDSGGSWGWRAHVHLPLEDIGAIRLIVM
jgi:hypothetical protein